MARSFAPVAALLILAACLLIAAAPRAEGAISCGTVASLIAPCLNYAKGVGPLPPQCCSGMRALNGMAKTTPDRQQACTCLKSAYTQIRGVKLPLVQGLPGKCGVSIGYPISPTVDCTKIR